jgi:hypothetical protein
MAGGSTIIFQILIGGDAKMKLVTIHAIKVVPAIAQPVAKAKDTK